MCIISRIFFFSFFLLPRVAPDEQIGDDPYIVSQAAPHGYSRGDVFSPVDPTPLRAFCWDLFCIYLGDL